MRATDPYGDTTVVLRTVIHEPAGAGANEPTAPAIASTQLDAFRSNTAFLYGAGGVQVGPDTGSFQVQRVAVIRGRVVQATETSDTLGLAHVRVRVVGHDEYGYTESRASGNFDLVVDGGGQLTLEFSRAGFATARRNVTVPWRDYVRLDDVALKGFDTRRVAVSLSDSAIVQGSRVDDGGTVRTPTMLFKAGTQATGINSSGGTVPLGSTLHVRATEFSVGVQGPRRMPAPLPSTSAYTHCVNLTVIEAETLGIERVNFSKPVAYYIENFLNIPVGAKVPVGSYSPDSGWKAEEDGRVIRVLSTAGGTATLDVTGDSLADTGAALTALGIDATELHQIAQTYHAGQSLWRSRMDHFSTWDWNFPFWWPADAIAPNGGWPFWLSILLGCGCEGPGSIIEMENQTLREAIGVVGTPYALNYSSARVTGNRRPYKIRVPLRKGNIPGSVNRVYWSIDVAGKHYGSSFENYTNAQNQSVAPEYVDMEWDGLDGFGRAVVGSINAHIKVGYAYGNAYGLTLNSGGGNSWGSPPSGAMLASTVRGNEGIIWTEFDLAIGTMRNEVAGLGGWSITPNHFYDFGGRGTLYRGDGTTEPGERVGPTIERLERGSTTAVFDAAYGPDGALYFAESDGVLPPAQQTNIKRRTNNGTPGGAVTVVVGSSVSADRTLPAQSTFALAPDGSIYVAEPANNRVRKFHTDGTSQIVAGTQGVFAESGDGGLATDAHFKTPSAIALGQDGTLYVVDKDAYTVRRIAPDGRISRFAGNGLTTPIVDTLASATQVALNIVNGRIRVGPHGDVFIAEQGSSRIRRVSPDGVIHTVAQLEYPTADMAVAPDGVLYALTGYPIDQYATPNGVYRLESGQPAVRVAGAATSGAAITAVPQPALGALLTYQSCMAFNRDGNLALGQFSSGGCSMALMRPALPGFSLSENVVVSSDASEKYVFDVTGRHLRTLDALTGGTRYLFTYQAYAGGNVRLASIRDMNGDVTTINRDGQGTPVNITAQDLQATTFQLSGAYLSRVTNPTGNEFVQLFAASASGLLDSLRDARGYSHQFQYEVDGRLKKDLAVDGFSTTLTMTSLPNDSLPDRGVQATSALNRSSSYGVDFRDARLTEIRTATGPDNLATSTTRHGDETVNVNAPDGTTLRYRPAPDPQFGMQAPFAESLAVRRPSGTTAVIQTSSFARAANYGDLAKDVAVNTRNYHATYTPISGGGGIAIVRPPFGSVRQESTTVDTAGRPLLSTLPGALADVVTHYDSRGRIDTLRVGGRRWEYHYEDARGRLSRIVDPLERTTRFRYDEADRLLAQVFPGGTDSVVFEHDPNGNLTALQPPGKAFHRFGYTPGELTRQYDPPDVPGLLTDTTHYTFDADRGLQTIERPDGPSVALGYYAGTGQLRTVTQPRGTAMFTYNGTSGNGAGEPATLSSPDGVSLSFGYDGSLPTSESWSFPGTVNGSVSYTYDANLWPTHQVVSGTSGAASDVTYGFDSDGLTTSATLSGGAALGLAPNAVTSVLDSTRVSGLALRYGYNPYAELTSAAAWYGTDTLYAARYERDNLGRITRIVETTANATTDRGYGYDIRGRLESVRDSLAHLDLARYGYDANGNRLRMKTGTNSDSASYDAQDRLVDRGAAHYTYTASGERLTRTDASGTVRTTYDLLGNLTKAKLASSDSVEYLIDGRNRRVGRKYGGVLTARWVYGNSLNVVGELDQSGALVKRFVYASRGHVPDLMVVRNSSGPDSTYRFVTDHLGSVRLVVNANTGFVAQRLNYDAWGVVTSDTRVGFTPFGYAGGLYDPATGLVRFGARDYDPVAGVWTCKDPVGFGGGAINFFAYVEGSDPVNAIDPTGLHCNTGFWDLWSQWADIRSAKAFWKSFGGSIGWVGAGLIDLSQLESVQDNSETLGDPSSNYLQKTVAVVGIGAVGAGWYLAATTRVTGAIAGQERTSRIIGVMNRYGEKFYTDKNGVFFAIDKAGHLFHIGPWRPF